VEARGRKGVRGVGTSRPCRVLWVGLGGRKEVKREGWGREGGKVYLWSFWGDDKRDAVLGWSE